MNHDGVQSHRRLFYVVVIPVLFAAIPFLPVLHNGFVNWDDLNNFEDNAHYRGLGWSNIQWAWTTFHLGIYQPFAWMLFGLEYCAFGMKPWGYHLCSLGLHVLVAIALYKFTAAVLEKTGPTCDENVRWLAAALATAVWAAHPLRVEVVAWASCQGYLPSALLAILSVWAYLLAHREEVGMRGHWYVCSLVLYAGSLLCKPVSLGLPAVLLILDFYPLGRISNARDLRNGIGEKWPYILVAALFAAVGYVGKEDSVHATHIATLSARPLQVCYSLCFYIVKTVFPLGLHAHYVRPSRVDLAVPQFFWSTILAALGCILLFCQGKRKPGLSAALISYGSIVLPYSGIVPFGSQLVADRYAYLATIPWTILLAASLLHLPRRWCTPIVFAVTLLAVAPGVLTWRQCQRWHDSESLWTHVLACGDPADPFAAEGLGRVMLEKGRLAEAEHHFRVVVKYMPRRSSAWYHLGLAMAGQSRPTEAMTAYEHAIAVDPYYLAARRNLASELAKRQQFDQAACHLGQVAKGRPGSAQAHYELGYVLARLGRYEEAKSELKETLRLSPGHASARQELNALLVTAERRVAP
jgi:Flp pilus assembly protein TadD